MERTPPPPRHYHRSGRRCGGDRSRPAASPEGARRSVLAGRRTVLIPGITGASPRKWVGSIVPPPEAPPLSCHAWVFRLGRGVAFFCFYSRCLFCCHRSQPEPTGCCENRLPCVSRLAKLPKLAPSALRLYAEDEGITLLLRISQRLNLGARAVVAVVQVAPPGKSGGC